MSVETMLALIGLVIVTGFFASFLFDKAKVPDVLLLLLMGVGIGRWLGPDTNALIRGFAPYFGAIALIMILFEGGLTLDFRSIAGQFHSAFVLALVSFLICMSLVAWAAYGWLHWGLFQSLMFGTIIGCTSSAVVMPTVKRIRSPKGTKALAVMEAVFSDTIAIVVLVALINLDLGAESESITPLRHFFKTFGVSLAVALPVGLIWLNILEWTKARPLSYLWTFALLVLLYAGVHTLEGSGAVAVFFLAVLIGNSRYLPKWMVFGKFMHDQELAETLAHGTVQWFHAELTFLVRSFFFVYIGLLFEPQYMQDTYLWVTMGFTAVICASRYVSVRLRLRGRDASLRPLLWALLPRGLVSAVLATLPRLRAGFPDRRSF